MKSHRNDAKCRAVSKAVAAKPIRVEGDNEADREDRKRRDDKIRSAVGPARQKAKWRLQYQADASDEDTP